MPKYRIGEFIEVLFEPKEEVAEKLNKEVIPNILESLWSGLQQMLNDPEVFGKITSEFENNRRVLSEFTNPGLYQGKKHIVYANAIDIEIDKELPEIDSKDLEAKVDVRIGKSKAKVRAYLFVGEIEK